MCDGTARHHLKRASINRAAGRGRAQINARLKRIELVELLRVGQDNPQARKQLGKAIATGERAANCALPINFTERLKTSASEFETNGRGTIEYREPPLQADPGIAALALCAGIDTIVSEDSDFHMLVGPDSPFGNLMLTSLKVRMTGIQELCLALGNWPDRYQDSM